MELKALRRILFAHDDDTSLGPIFKGVLRKAVSADPILSAVGLVVDTVGFQGSEGVNPPRQVSKALNAIDVHLFNHASKTIQLHPDLITWADIILVPSLLEEDLLCLNFHQAWSKTLPVECFCEMYQTEIVFHAGYTPHTEDECHAAVNILVGLLPLIVNKLKDSYSDAFLARGVPIKEGTAVGAAFVVKEASDLEKFQEKNILVMDRPGAVLFQNTDLGMDTFEAVLTKAKAAVFSRGRHSGETSARAHGIPCISSCVGATEHVINGQTLIVDAGRGEVYDASILQNLG